MLTPFSFFSKLPGLKSLGLKPYLFDFSLNRLVSGVDNIHLDVHISPQVHSIIKAAAYTLMIRHSGTETLHKDHPKTRRESAMGKLREACADVLLDGINRAKAQSEVQIDFLGQVSLAKLFLEEVANQYNKLMEYFENLIRTYDLSPKHDSLEGFRIKEKFSEIRQNRNRLLSLAGKDLFHLLADVNASRLQNIRESNYPPEHILPDSFFLNPMIYAYPAGDDPFLIQEYVLIGQRSEDPDNHNSLKRIAYDIMRKTDLVEANLENSQQLDGTDSLEPTEEALLSAEGKIFDPWIMELGNIDRMLNCFDSKEDYQKARARKVDKQTLAELKFRLRVQEKLLDQFYRRFNQSKLIDWVVAAFEAKAIYERYCPPLMPWQVREFILRSGSRKTIVRQLKRLKTFYDKPLSLSPLYRAIRRVKRCRVSEKKRHLLNYLKHFFRYHRDLKNYHLLKDAIDAVILVRKEKILKLSRLNYSLYEFLPSDEQVREDKPILNHVIIKADIRGSTDITYMMRTRGLNPASYFSLNFFDPISEILFDYAASKEFIEGDAIILSLVEYDASPQGWYSVARACGLAVRMLEIVQRYNTKSQKHNLPVLELGIGICYESDPPAFLFDGDSRIMISPAINLADRLSGCDKRLGRRFKAQNRLFNLYVFHNAKEEPVEATKDDLFLRYNVNGIELNPAGFAKLSREVNLKSFLCPVGNNEKVKLYVGKVPTVTGKIQSLIVREAAVLELDPETLDVTGKTAGKYYEVCTHPHIYEAVRNLE